MNKLAVIGNPIEHSLSPLIWLEMAKSIRINLEYNKILAPIDDFEYLVKEFFATGGLALSVTSPFKLRAYELANIHDSSIGAGKSANHLINKAGVIYAYNTDGLGLILDLKRLNFSIQAKKILILGSGGVVNSILSSLIQENPLQIDLLARNEEKLEKFLLCSSKINAFNPEEAYDLILNTTPNSMDNQLFKQNLAINSGGVAYDLNYTPSIFLAKFKKQPVILANGLGMLIYQAKEAFDLVFNLKPKVDGIFQKLLK